MTAKPRRWFTFSLRTMFIAVTLLCGWLAWESSIVRHRQSVLREVRQNAAFSITTADGYAARFPPGAAPPKVARVSLVRRLLGDEAIQEVFVARYFAAFSEEKLARLVKAFPEAEFRETHPEPCHPGCFPGGTTVETPAGPRPIESIGPGDLVIAIRSDGAAASIQVQSKFVTTNRLWKIETQAGHFFTTQTQPLCLAAEDASVVGQIVPAGELAPGAMILRRDGDNLRAVKVLSAAQTDRVETVFNLVLGDRELFVAGGYLARSKPPPDS